MQSSYALVILFLALATALPNGQDDASDSWIEKSPSQLPADTSRDWVQYPADAKLAVLIDAEDAHVHDPHWSVANHDKAFELWQKDFGFVDQSAHELELTKHHHKDCCERAKMHLIQAMAANSTAKHTCHNSECGKSLNEWKRERNGYGKGKGAEDRCGKKSDFRFHLCGGPHKDEPNKKGCRSITHDEAKAHKLLQDEKMSELIAMRAKQSMAAGAKVQGPSCSKTHHNTGDVRNQGSCGQCWTFSVVERLRHAMIEQHGRDPGKLSTQFLTNCLRKTSCSGGVDGCCGGDPASAVEWIKRQGGIPTQADYGHICNDAACSNAPSLLETDKVFTPKRSLLQVSESGQGITWAGQHPMTSYTCKTVKKAVVVDQDPTHMSSESEMASHVCSKGTLMVAVDASAWQTYKNGVMSNCGTSIDHAVLLVGVSQEHNAWLIRNSWGTGWGASPTDPNAEVSKDQYSNCPDLVKSYGCSQALSGGVTTGEVCKASCPPASGAVTGGYIWLKYGQGTCGVDKEAYDTPAVSLASGASSTDASAEEGNDNGSSSSEGYTSDGYSSDKDTHPTPPPTPPPPPPPADACVDDWNNCMYYTSYCSYFKPPVCCGAGTQDKHYTITVPGVGNFGDICKQTCGLCSRR